MKNDNQKNWAEQLLHNKTPGELKRLYSKITPFYMGSAGGAFLASLIFVASVWLGGAWEPSNWTGLQWTSISIAALMVGGITAGQYFAYGSGIKSRGMVVFKVIVILFAVGSEVFATMEREADTVRHRSENSAVFKQTVAAIGTSAAAVGVVATASPALLDAQAAKAKSEVELKSCTRYKSQSSIDRCTRIEQGNVAAATAKISAAQTATASGQAAQQSQTLALTQAAKALQFDESQHFQGIQFLQKVLGISATAAAFVFAFGIIGTFEAMFYLLGVLLAAVGLALKSYGLTTKGTPLADEYAALGLTAVSTPTAPAATPPVAAPAPVATYREQLQAAGVSVPLADQAMDKPGFGFIPVYPRSQKIGATGNHNPALGTHEQHYSLPLSAADSAKAIHAPEHAATLTSKRECAADHTGSTNSVATLTSKRGDDSDSVYQRLKQSILNGEVSPTFIPVKKLLKSWEFGKNDKDRQEWAAWAFEKMHRENVLKLNPANDGTGIQKAKYILA